MHQVLIIYQYFVLMLAFIAAILIVVNYLFPRKVQPFIIGIAGTTCSGKTTVSKEIVSKCNKKGLKAIIISQDNYYNGGNEDTNYDVPEAIDFDLLNQHLAALKSGKSVKMPCYDFSTHSRNGYKLVKPAAIIVLEGILIFANETTCSLLDNRVFIEADDNICLERRVKRDVEERGRSEEEVRNRYAKHVADSNVKYVKPSVKNAHMVLNNYSDFEFVGLELFIGCILAKFL